jgi:hypothetical protein
MIRGCILLEGSFSRFYRVGLNTMYSLGPKDRHVGLEFAWLSVWDGVYNFVRYGLSGENKIGLSYWRTRLMDVVALWSILSRPWTPDILVH